MRTAVLVCLLLYSFTATGQGYFKLFAPPSYEAFIEGVPVDDNRYAFITTNAFHVIDASGNEVVKTPLVTGMSTFLEAMSRDEAGNFWIAANVFVTLTTYQRILYKLNIDGQILQSKTFDLPVASDYMKIMARNNNVLLLHRKVNSMGRHYIQGECFDGNLNLKWSKPVSLELFSRYALRPDESGSSVSIAYMNHDRTRVWVTGIDFTGTLFHHELAFKPDPQRQEYTDNFARTPDGGFVMTGSTLAAGKLEDGLIYKTDAGGFVEWTRRLDIHLGDRLRDVMVAADGYYVFGESGFKDWVSTTNGEWVLLKLDLHGNELWRKAFGGPAADYATSITSHNGNLYLGGRCSNFVQATAVPAVCRTDLNGNFATNNSLSIEPVSAIHDLAGQTGSVVTQFVTSMETTNGDLIVAGNYKGPDDATYAFAQRQGLTGNVTWYLPISPIPGTLRFGKRVGSDQYLAAIERKSAFVNLYELVLFDKNANVIWRKENGSSSLKDVIPTSEGGLLLVGAEDVTFVDYEVVLIKLDAGGTELWRKRIGRSGQWETGRQVVETPEQDFLIVGNSQDEYAITSKVHVLKVDANGNERWSKSVAGPPAAAFGHAISPTGDGQYIIAGTENAAPYNNRNLLLIRITGDGAVVWEKRFDLSANEDGVGLLPANGGGFLIGGTTGDPGSGKLERYSFVMKVNGAGNREWTKYYGVEGVITGGQNFAIVGNDTVLVGTRQERYGYEKMFYINVSGIRGGDPIAEEGLHLWPNPATVFTRLSITDDYIGPMVVAFYDASGKRCIRYAAQKSANGWQQDIDIRSLASGVYFVCIYQGSKILRMKLLVQGK